MTIQFVGYVLLVRLLIYTIQKFPLVSKLPSWVRELVSCDFCFGCWLYFGGNLLFKINISGIEYVPIVSEFLFGIAISFIMHLVSAGWNSIFQVINFE